MFLNVTGDIRQLMTADTPDLYPSAVTIPWKHATCSQFGVWTAEN